MNNTIPLYLISHQVQNALDEDLAYGDITASLIAADKQAHAQLIVRESAVICGSQWFELAFLLLDKNCSINWHVKDSDISQENQIICDIKGNARAMLSAERTALNFLQTLSGTATITRHYVDQLTNSNIRLLDTRKTIPGLRAAQKYAVLCGGGFNHRQGLFDGVLIKENHISAAGGISQAVTKAQQTVAHGLKIEIEVETLEEVQQALEAKADILLLDNMPIEMLQQAVTLNNSSHHKAKLEVSGDINDKKLQQLSLIAIDYISVGSITKHIKAVDFSLRF